MPKGVFRPVAKTCTCSGLPCLVIPRKTLMSPAVVSARNISPLGALRRIRGLVSPVAYRPTLKPSRRLGPRVFRAGHDRGTAYRGFGSIGLGKVSECNVADGSRLLETVIGKRRLAAGARWRFRGCCSVRRRLRGCWRGSAHGFDKGDQLPALLRGQSRPGRHSIFQSTFGDVPEDGAIRHTLQGSMSQRRHIACAFPGNSMAGCTVAGIAGFAGRLSRTPARHRDFSPLLRVAGAL